MSTQKSVAEEIAELSGVVYSDYSGPELLKYHTPPGVIRSVNEALEWCARLCDDAASSVQGSSFNQLEAMPATLAERIRRGKKEL